MAVLAWLTVLTGTYIIYPWYRAVPPPGTADLAAYPQRLLMSSPRHAAAGTRSAWSGRNTWPGSCRFRSPWRSAVFSKYRRNLKNNPELRTVVLCFVVVSFFAAGVAGFFGAMLNKHAPVEGGTTIRLMEGESP